MKTWRFSGGAAGRTSGRPAGSFAVILCAIGLAACSGSSALPEPAILATVDCVRPEDPGPLFALDRFDASIAGFETSDRANPQEPGGVVFTGSSSMVFWQSAGADMAPLPIINRGFGGSVIPQATHYASRIIHPYEPRAVVLYSGDNDVGFGGSPDCVLEDLRLFRDEVRRQDADLPIYVLAIKPSFARAVLWEQMEHANELMAALASTDRQMTFIDVATPMFLPGGELNPDLFVADGLHMSPEGYALWTSIVRPILHDDLL